MIIQNQTAGPGSDKGIEMARWTQANLAVRFWVRREGRVELVLL